MRSQVKKLASFILAFVIVTVLLMGFPGFGDKKAYAADISYIIKTVAGTGSHGYSGDNGAAILAQLQYPDSVAVDSSGNLYIADTLNHRIRKVDTLGNISTVAGRGVGGFTGDGLAATEAELHQPMGVAVDSGGNLYIADYYNNRIRKVDKFGIISSVDLANTLMNGPTGVAVDNSGNLYISDCYGAVFKVDVTLYAYWWPNNNLNRTFSRNGFCFFLFVCYFANSSPLGSPEPLTIKNGILGTITIFGKVFGI